MWFAVLVILSVALILLSVRSILSLGVPNGLIVFFILALSLLIFWPVALVMFLATAFHGATIRAAKPRQRARIAQGEQPLDFCARLLAQACVEGGTVQGRAGRLIFVARPGMTPMQVAETGVELDV